MVFEGSKSRKLEIRLNPQLLILGNSTTDKKYKQFHNDDPEKGYIFHFTKT
jgi:hypothetical protein